MGRPKKNKNGTSLITISLDNDVLEQIDTKAKSVDKNRSEFIKDVLNTFALTEEDFCNMMAKKAAQDMCYWQSRRDSIKAVNRGS